MTSAVTAVFYLHTVLFTGYAAYLAHLAVNWAGRRWILCGHDLGEGADSDEAVVLVAGHVSLLLYLLYAEAYLYRSCHLLS